MYKNVPNTEICPFSIFYSYLNLIGLLGLQGLNWLHTYQLLYPDEAVVYDTVTSGSTTYDNLSFSVQTPWVLG